MYFWSTLNNFIFKIIILDDFFIRMIKMHTAVTNLVGMPSKLHD
jgi:hypothetical protein